MNNPKTIDLKMNRSLMGLDTLTELVLKIHLIFKQAESAQSDRNSIIIWNNLFTFSKKKTKRGFNQ